MRYKNYPDRKGNAMYDCQIQILTIVKITTFNASMGKPITEATQHKHKSREIKIASESDQEVPQSHTAD